MKRSQARVSPGGEIAIRLPVCPLHRLGRVRKIAPLLAILDQAIYGLMNLALQVILARSVSQEEFGAYSVGSAFFFVRSEAPSLATVPMLQSTRGSMISTLRRRPLRSPISGSLVASYRHKRHVFVSTLEPQTAPGSSWTAADGQIVHPVVESRRQTFNAAVRAGIPGTAGFFDLAAVSELSPGLGKGTPLLLDAACKAMRAI
jgi:hypothetical protein